MKRYRKLRFSNDLFCEYCVYFKGWSEDCGGCACCMERETIYKDEQKPTQPNALDPCIHIPASLKNQSGGHEAQGPVTLPHTGKDAEIWRFFE